MKLGLAQLRSTNSLEQKPRALFFPENSLFFRIDQNESVLALSLTDKIFLDFVAWSQRTGIDLFVTTPINTDGDVTNSIVHVSAIESAPRIAYSKIHLFDIALHGQSAIRESDHFVPGNSPGVVQLDGLRIGLSVCYDIRFSELYSYYGRNEVDLILIPAAFLVKTGQAHWHTLLRARAIENQCFVVAPAQAGRHESARSEQFRETFGHSLVIDPWGAIILEKPQGQGVEFFEIDVEQNYRVRTQIPMKSHRRL
jgi:deaminated glutathione amidase